MSDDKKELMIYSTREGGYRHQGVKFGRAPMAITVVDARPNESDADGLKRRRRGDWTMGEIKKVLRVIYDAEGAKVEPALVILDAVSEVAAVDRQIAEKRAQLDGVNDLLKNAAIERGKAVEEVEVVKRLAAEASRQSAQEFEKVDKAKRQLADIEGKIGKLRALKKENEGLKAEVARLKAAAEK